MVQNTQASKLNCSPKYLAASQKSPGDDEMIVHGAFVQSMVLTRFVAAGPGSGTHTQSSDDAVVKQIVIQRVLSAHQKGARQTVNCKEEGRVGGIEERKDGGKDAGRQKGGRREGSKE